jgi:branched-chain amino acid transport system permease protein
MNGVLLSIALAVIVTAPAWVWNPYHLHTLIMAGIFAVLALSLNLLLGYTGQLSLGHAAFFGIGAYATGLLTVRCCWPRPASSSAASR